VCKKLVEGVGGFIVGAAPVALIGDRLKKDPPTGKKTKAETSEVESQA
jgi:hypothetical protein